MVGIYKITNILENKHYIGQSINIEVRWRQHHYNATHTVKREENRKLYQAFHIFGIDNFNFEVLEECELSFSQLNNQERYWIEYYNSYNDGYNMTKGGQGEDSWLYDPQIIRDLWDEGYTTGTIAKIVGCSSTTVNNRLQGYNNFNTYTSHTRSCGVQAREKWKIESNINYQIKGDQLLYFSEPITVYQYSLSGEYLASYPTIEAAAKAVNGKYPSSIGLASLGKSERLTAYGYQWRRDKINSLSPVPLPRGKLVQCIETGHIFPSTAEAAKWCGLKSKSNIRECCVGIVKSAGKHPTTGEKLHWKYIE